MESMASISVSTQLSTGSINQPANENMDKSTSEAWSGNLKIQSFQSAEAVQKLLSTGFMAWR